MDFVTHRTMVNTYEPNMAWLFERTNNLKDVGRTKSHVKNHQFVLWSKVNLHVSGSWYIHVPNMVSRCQSKKKKSYGPDTKTCQKSHKFDIEVKGQCRIGFMNVRDTSSHGVTPMCLICKQISKPKKKIWCPDMGLTQ